MYKCSVHRHDVHDALYPIILVKIIDAYSRILMLEQRKGRYSESGKPDLMGNVFVFDSLLLVCIYYVIILSVTIYHIKGLDMFLPVCDCDTSNNV